MQIDFKSPENSEAWKGPEPWLLRLCGRLPRGLPHSPGETDLRAVLTSDQRLLAQRVLLAERVFMELWSRKEQHVSITRVITPYTVSLFNERRVS